MSKTMALVAVVISLLIGLGLGYKLIPAIDGEGMVDSAVEREPLFYRNPMNPEVTSPVPAKDSMGMDYVPVYTDEDQPQKREILFYRSPMNPEVTSPVPAKDAMGMDYVPVYAEDNGGDVAGTVKISPVVQNNIGLRTATAEIRNMSRTIRTLGRVDFDEEKVFRLHPKIDGWITNIRVDKTGQPVAEDEILLDFYSPKLVSTQQEYLLAIENYAALKSSSFEDIRSGAQGLVASSRARLRLLDVPEHQIKELEETHTVKESVHIHSPAGGTVMHIGVREGQYVTPATELYQIVDLSTVWVFADVYEYELPWIREGDVARMTMRSLPGKVLEGSVSYIYPYAESKTRTTKVRLVFDNPDLLLRPDTFSEITVQSQERSNLVVVPAEAVVRSGSYDQIFVMKEEGTFEPRKVKLGVESGEDVAVLDGIQAGERVVVSAQFLIDSESKLREATAKMLNLDETEGDSSSQHKEGAH
jgi:membrane fusion protein, copper/silver efflux system